MNRRHSPDSDYRSLACTLLEAVGRLSGNEKRASELIHGLIKHRLRELLLGRLYPYRPHGVMACMDEFDALEIEIEEFSSTATTE